MACSASMNNHFFERAILNGLYDYPERHWEFNDEGQPTQQIIDTRRHAKFITSIPKPTKRKATQSDLSLTKERGFPPRHNSPCH